MRVKFIEATTIEDARQQISELQAGGYQAGDKIVVAYPNRQQIVFVCRNMEQVENGYVITPDGGL